MSDTAAAIILARAGSKGVPGKNMRVVGGRCCIEWTLDAAFDAEGVGPVVVSTDDPDAMAIACDHGAEVCERPADLAHDTATIDDAARHAVRTHPALAGVERFVILYANVPVRPEALIDRALTRLIETNADSVQSYAPVGKHHPWWTARVDDHGAVTPWEGDVLNHGVYRRQDLPGAYIPDGGVIALTRRALMLEIDGVPPGPHAFFGLDRRGVVTGEGEVVDIDREDDLLVADAVLSSRACHRGQRAGQREAPARTADGLHAELTRAIIGAAIEVHRHCGTGLLESFYESALEFELVRLGHRVQRQVVLGAVYKGQPIGQSYRADLLVDDAVIVEIKAVRDLDLSVGAQLSTYLRLSSLRVGLVLNFHAPRLVDGIRRIVSG